MQSDVASQLIQQLTHKSPELKVYQAKWASTEDDGHHYHHRLLRERLILNDDFKVTETDAAVKDVLS